MSLKLDFETASMVSPGQSSIRTKKPEKMMTVLPLGRKAESIGIKIRALRYHFIIDKKNISIGIFKPTL